jgi:exoribonuclease-2
MIWVTIADVAERVSSTSAVDDYASKQGQTVYKNGKAIRPMLPYELSENRCSLQEGVLRPGISMIIASTLTRPYKILDIGWSLSCVRNKRQYDYDTFIEKADFDITPIKEIAEDILGYSTDDTHKWVEAYMLKYNLETAKILRQVGHGILRRHAGPEKTKWETYLNWGGESLAVLANAAAEYCGANEPADHVGLGQSAYCHATSPIRRYADLVNQRILKSHINQELISPPHVSIDWLNARQRNGKRYERDIFFLQNLSGQLEGIVLSEKKVWIESWKRMMTWKNTLEPGTHVQLQFFANPNARRWKERIVFRRVEDIL